jgi:microfibrillar-associated protein 1
MSSQKRMTANPLKPGRHFPGKVAEPESSSESEGSGSEQEKTTKKAPPRRAPLPRFANAAGPGRVISRGDGAKINLKGVGLGEDAEDEEARRKAAKAARLEAERKAKEEGFVTEDEEEEGSEEEGSEEESEEEEESSSEEEEAPRRLMMRPKFIPKSQRQANGSTPAATAATTIQSHPPEHDDEAAAAAAEAARLRAADELIEEQIKKDLAARAAGRKHWEDDADAGSEKDEVDDTDDVDPAAEYAAWKLRELKRLRREREAIEAREKELAEIERRRNLTEEERQAEDDAHLAQQRDEKEGRAKMGYMQKYFHKGAFYQDESKAAGLDKRDIAGARFADDVNRELLPKALQMRDMTKVGKKGATKYRDLKSEDTGQWGRFSDGRPGRGFDRDVDERFQPDDRRRDWEGGRESDVKGANAITLGSR